MGIERVGSRASERNVRRKRQDADAGARRVLVISPDVAPKPANSRSVIRPVRCVRCVRCGCQEIIEEREGLLDFLFGEIVYLPDLARYFVPLWHRGRHPLSSSASADSRSCSPIMAGSTISIAMRALASRISVDVSDRLR